eukprot:3933342-Rhodomonas_salina.3
MSAAVPPDARVDTQHHSSSVGEMSRPRVPESNECAARRQTEAAPQVRAGKLRHGEESSHGVERVDVKESEKGKGQVAAVPIETELSSRHVHTLNLSDLLEVLPPIFAPTKAPSASKRVDLIPEVRHTRVALEPRDDARHQDTHDDRSLDLVLQHHANNEHRADAEPRCGRKHSLVGITRIGRIAGVRVRSDGEKVSGVVGDLFGVQVCCVSARFRRAATEREACCDIRNNQSDAFSGLQPEMSEEHADSSGHGQLETLGNQLGDQHSESSDGEDEEHDALDEHGGERSLPRDVSGTPNANDIIREVCVQPHSRGQSEGKVRKAAHEDARGSSRHGSDSDKLAAEFFEALVILRVKKSASRNVFERLTALAGSARVTQKPGVHCESHARQ